jgi:hypothetical protein
LVMLNPLCAVGAQESGLVNSVLVMLPRTPQMPSLNSILMQYSDSLTDTVSANYFNQNWMTIPKTEWQCYCLWISNTIVYRNNIHYWSCLRVSIK